MSTQSGTFAEQFPQVHFGGDLQPGQPIYGHIQVGKNWIRIPTNIPSIGGNSQFEFKLPNIQNALLIGSDLKIEGLMTVDTNYGHLVAAIEDFRFIFQRLYPKFGPMALDEFEYCGDYWRALGYYLKSENECMMKGWLQGFTPQTQLGDIFAWRGFHATTAHNVVLETGSNWGQISTVNGLITPDSTSCWPNLGLAKGGPNDGTGKRQFCIDFDHSLLTQNTLPLTMFASPLILQLHTKQPHECLVRFAPTSRLLPVAKTIGTNSAGAGEDNIGVVNNFIAPIDWYAAVESNNTINPYSRVLFPLTDMAMYASFAIPLDNTDIAALSLGSSNGGVVHFPYQIHRYERFLVHGAAQHNFRSAVRQQSVNAIIMFFTISPTDSNGKYNPECNAKKPQLFNPGVQSAYVRINNQRNQYAEDLTAGRSQHESLKIITGANYVEGRLHDLHYMAPHMIMEQMNTDGLAKAHLYPLSTFYNGGVQLNTAPRFDIWKKTRSTHEFNIGNDKGFGDILIPHKAMAHIGPTLAGGTDGNVLDTMFSHPYLHLETASYEIVRATRDARNSVWAPSVQCAIAPGCGYIMGWDLRGHPMTKNFVGAGVNTSAATNALEVIIKLYNTNLVKSAAFPLYANCYYLCDAVLSVDLVSGTGRTMN